MNKAPKINITNQEIYLFLQKMEEILSNTKIDLISLYDKMRTITLVGEAVKHINTKLTKGQKKKLTEEKKTERKQVTQAIQVLGKIRDLLVHEYLAIYSTEENVNRLIDMAQKVLKELVQALLASQQKNRHELSDKPTKNSENSVKILDSTKSSNYVARGFQSKNKVRIEDQAIYQAGDIFNFIADNIEKFEIFNEKRKEVGEQELPGLERAIECCITNIGKSLIAINRFFDKKNANYHESLERYCKNKKAYIFAYDACKTFQKASDGLAHANVFIKKEEKLSLDALHNNISDLKKYVATMIQGCQKFSAMTEPDLLFNIKTQRFEDKILELEKIVNTIPDNPNTNTLNTEIIEQNTDINATPIETTPSNQATGSGILKQELPLSEENESKMNSEVLVLPTMDVVETVENPQIEPVAEKLTPPLTPLDNDKNSDSVSEQKFFTRQNQGLTFFDPMDNDSSLGKRRSLSTPNSDSESKKSKVDHDLNQLAETNKPAGEIEQPINQSQGSSLK